MNNKIYLDINIVADMIDQNRKEHEKSLEILKKTIWDATVLCISEDTLSTLFYISKDKNATLLFIQNVILVDWEVSIFGKSVISKAIELSLQKGLDLEDLLQCLCAQENKCNILITNDKKFYDCGMKIYTSDEFLTL